MSGSRSITLTLSVKDAEKVRAQLEQMGKDGEAALDRLDKAAQRAASRQSLGGVETAAGNASNGMGRFNQTIQQGGYQLGDFVVQVQGGTSALTALSQQGSQFLGMFGPVGAVAGVALSIGTIAASFISTGSAADQAKVKGQEALDAMAKSAVNVSSALREVNALFQSAGERAAYLANAQRAEMRGRYTTELTTINSGQQELRRRLSIEEGYLTDLRQPGASTLYRAENDNARNLETQAIVNVRNLRSELAAAERNATALQEAIRRVDNSGRVGVEEFGPTSADPGGFNSMRASYSDRARAEVQYQAALTEIRTKAANGLLTEAQATELSTLALGKRNDELESLTRAEAARARGDAGRAVRDQSERDKALLGDIPAVIRDINQAYDQYQAQQEVIFSNTQKTIDANAEQLTLLGSEAALVGQNADARGRELAIIKERRRIIAAGITDEEQIAKLLEQTGQLYDRQLDLAQRKNSFDDLANAGERAFDRIGSAITAAFTDGSLKAIDFGNISKAVLSEIAQAALRLAVVNPVLNSVFGGTRGTISGLMGSTSLSGAPSASSPSMGVSDYLSAGGDAGKLLFGGSGTAYSGVNTGFSWLDSGLNASAYSVGTPAAGWSSSMAGPYSAANPAGGLSNVSYAQAGLGAVGVAGGLYGIYAGTQQGGAKGWATGTAGAFGTLAGASTLAGGSAALGTASAGLLGAGGGAVLGAVAAAAPYIAAVLAIASLFLPGQKPSDMTGVYLGNLANGESSVGGLGGDRYSQENRDQATQIGQQIATLGDSLKAALGVGTLPFNYSVSLGARDGLVAGYNGTTKHYNADEAGSKQMIADITVAMIDSMKGLASAEIQSIIGASGGNTETLLGNLDWYNGTYKAMIAQSENPITQWQQSITALMTPIDEAITKARELGLSEDKLNEVRARGLQALADQRTATLDALAANDRARQATAAGVSALTQQIQAWSGAAQAEITALNEQLIQLGLDQGQRDPWLAERWRTLDAEQGALVRQRDQQSAANSNGLWDRFQSASGGSSTLEGARWDYERKAATEWMAAVADGMTDLTLLARVQNEERLQIERNFAEQAAALDQQNRQTAQSNLTTVFGGITGFIQSLQLGDASILSPQGKLDLAQRQFDDLAARARAGDTDAIGQFTNTAGNLLTAGRDYYASSGGYADLQRQVLSVAESITSISLDTLTADAMARIQKDSDATVVAGFKAANDELKTEIRLLRLEMQGMMRA